ncbi:peptidylprolyl isomerase [Microbacterium terrae]|uniref:Peptidyl-prolyl cis-trans isomerase n=1 Tax=Microbacterium terrae TaxID=69369 RepID=A0A0M2HI20_9MICO|nr:FKBP-type peptidyl-prolyl cis-trans isomerase [Microbacterium terrae]KJL43961.1 FK506-binding protein [Microbacterium terrae]MBP1077831.1 peptidylprolyl isomerase [Microbacterium terrae]GLK00002.1 peptidylprolyl isomerase [Microbacterium terrae]
MRFRPLAALSVAAVSALLLVGCSSSSPESTPTPTDTAGADLCSVAAPEGDVASSITVSGEVGAVPTVEFETPLEITTSERAVAVEGDGDAISDGDYVSYALGIYDATTGEPLQEAGFDGTALPAMPISVGSGPDVFFGCATEGSRIVMTVPDAGSGAQVYVIDVLDIVPADAWCAVSEPTGEFPSVEFDADGNPTVTIPDAEAPADVQLEVLEEGDGATVEAGDSVTVDYQGVKWSDGSVFDSSYERGEPATFATTGVVTGFQRALEGQTVGTKLVVSMSPGCGYGEEGSSTHELAGETLVFVVEIIETTPAE